MIEETPEDKRERLDGILLAMYRHTKVTNRELSNQIYTIFINSELYTIKELEEQVTGFEFLLKL